MKNQKSKNIGVNELHEMLSKQLRELSEMPLNDKNINKQIAKSKEIFNGSGKLINLAVYQLTLDQLQIGTNKKI